MSELSLAKLRILSDLVVYDFIAWVEQQPEEWVYDFHDVRYCPVARYVSARIDEHVLPDVCVIGNILVEPEDVWGITHAPNTPILHALRGTARTLTINTFGALAVRLREIKDAIEFSDDFDVIRVQSTTDAWAALSRDVIRLRRDADNSERNEIVGWCEL